MKFFTAFLATETNTFAAAPTGWGSFQEYGVYRGDASTRNAQGYGQAPRLLREWLAQDGHELVESLLAFAMPGGRTVRSVYEGLRDDILADLRAAGPVDGVILILHGAMVAQGLDDCEGDLIERVRQIVGPEVPIGVELDLHCHFTARMHRHADLIVAYKEYPHTDAAERMREVLRLVVDAAQRRIRPVTAVFDCHMVGLWHTTREPMAGFVRRMQEVERQPGVLSVSLGHGFPWADVEESGAKLWVVTDGDPDLAGRLAEQLGREFWELREATRMPELGPAAAVTRALALAAEPVLDGQGGPVVLADMADNPGGGAMGDSTFLLRELLAQDAGPAAMGGFWDLGAVRLCADAGAGAQLDLRLGGKCGPTSGSPLDLRVTVMAVKDAHDQAGLSGDEERVPLGTSVWVRTEGGLDLVLTSRRCQVLSPQFFTGLGVDLARQRLVVVKSAQHFHARFAPLARAVLYVNSPGTVDTDFERLPYRLRHLDYWPRVAQPQGLRATPAPTLAVAPPGRLYTVDDLQLHLHLTGPVAAPGQPTVVIESGGGTVSPLYARLQQALAQKYPVCTVDRPGLGWSSPDTRPLDATRHAHRLHALLAAAGITGPVLFIGHSLGGLLCRVHAGLYPQQVAGLLMLDASHEDQFLALGEAMAAQLDSVRGPEREKRQRYREGGDTPPELLTIATVFADMPEVVKQMQASYRPEAVDAMVLEMREAVEIARQAAAVTSLGDLPLAVLWAPPRLTGANPGIDTILQRWPDYQRAHATLSTRGTVREVVGSEHMAIAVLPPFVAQVVDAVDGLMAQIAEAPCA